MDRNLPEAEHEIDIFQIISMVCDYISIWHPGCFRGGCEESSSMNSDCAPGRFDRREQAVRKIQEDCMKEVIPVLFYGYFLAAVVSAVAVWGALIWSMTRSVYPAGRAKRDSGMAVTALDDADDALRAASGYIQREEERTQTKRLNAIFEAEANLHRAA